MSLRTLRLGLIALFVALAGPSFAADPGTSSGTYDREGVKFSFSHAIALSQDNTEGLLDHGAQVRILLSAEEVPIEALYGIAFPPVRGMASDGTVHGLLLEFDPTDRSHLWITVLNKGADPDAFAGTISISSNDDLWKSLQAGPERIAGEYPSDHDTDIVFSFSAPVFNDPVQADLKDADAQNSAPMKVLLARADALQKGDMATVIALSSRQSAADLKTMSPDQLKDMTQSMQELAAQLKSVKRVVVRRATAVAIIDGGCFSTLVLENGAWKVAD